MRKEEKGNSIQIRVLVVGRSLVHLLGMECYLLHLIKIGYIFMMSKFYPYLSKDQLVH